MRPFGGRFGHNPHDGDACRPSRTGQHAAANRGVITTGDGTPARARAFRDVDATLDAAAGTLDASVPVTSLDLNNPLIRERMLFADFLDAVRFPDVRWTARIEADPSRAIAPGGELSIHGRTQTVAASGRIGLPGPGLLTPDNRAGIELAATIDRRDIGLHWQEEMPDGGDTLGWDVTLEALLELVERP